MANTQTLPGQVSLTEAFLDKTDESAKPLIRCEINSRFLFTG